MWPQEHFCRLGDVLARQVLEVDDRSDLAAIPIIEKISFGGIVSVTEPDERANYKGRLFWAEVGDLIYSKIRVKQGSLAIVSADVGRIAVSAEYPVYRPVESKVVPEYLALLLKSSSFLRFLDGLSSGGATKTRIAPDVFESLTIALPPLATQRAIVAHWRAAQESLAATAQTNDEHEAAIRRNFLEALGLSDRLQVINRRAFALRWTEFERWGVEQARKVSGSLDPAESRFPVVRLREIIAGLQNGWSPKCFDRPAGADEWGVLKLGAVSFGTFNENENKALPSSFTPLLAHEVKPDDVLFIRGNVLRLVGACSHVATTRPRLMMPDLVFRAVFREESEIDRRYLAEVMRTPHLRQQIEAVATGTSPTMKKISKPGLLALRLPLPPLAIQRQLVAEVTAPRARIAAARAAAAQLAADTAREVEEMILGVRPALTTRTAKS